MTADSTPPEQSKPHFDKLDSLRCIAAFWVLTMHCTTDNLSYLNLPTPIKHIVPVLLNGAMWVDFFFTLSGFLVTYLLIIEKKAGKFSFRKFFIRRTLRIWPLYFVIIGLSFVVIPGLASLLFGARISTSTVWYYLTFLSNFDMMEIYRMNDFFRTPWSANITWSVAIEEQFYIIWAVVFRYLNLRSIGIFIVACIVISCLFSAFNVEHLAWIRFHSLSNLSYFSFGALAAFLVQKYPAIKVVKLSPYHYTLLLFLAIGVVIPQKGNLVIVQKVLCGTFFAWFILIQCFSKSLPLSFLKNSTLIYWGKRSYGIYLIHLVFQGSLTAVLMKLRPGISGGQLDAIVFPLTLLLTLLSSALSYRYFESYFLKLKARFY